jgi:hypothetical protein
MSFESLLIHSVTIFNLASGSSDRYGDETEEWDEGTTVNGRMDQLSNDDDFDEYLQDRDTRVIRSVLFLMPDAPINALSELEYEGVRHRVVSEPIIVDDSVGPHHIEALVESIQG